MNVTIFRTRTGQGGAYGVYDINGNEAGVSVGISHDTAEFAVEAIRRWWQQLGRKRYGNPRRLLMTADSGGSNSSRCRLWKVELQKLADETGMIIEVCHYPPGTSKWNKIEHRVFCHITRNWQGVPLETLEIVVNLIGATRTETGLEVHAGSTKISTTKDAKSPTPRWTSFPSNGTRSTGSGTTRSIRAHKV